MSAGFHRLGSSVPGKLSGWSNKANLQPVTLEQLERAAAAMDAVMVPEENRAILSDVTVFSPGPSARDMGYTGDTCSICGSDRMKMAGHCQVCESCGSTTGCS